MKYSDKYPKAKPSELVDATIMRSKKTDNCYCCGALTNFIDTDFETYICSDECEEKLMNDFFQQVVKKK